MNGNIFNSKGVHVGVVTGDAVFGLKGQRRYDLKGSNIYKLNGDLDDRFHETCVVEQMIGWRIPCFAIGQMRSGSWQDGGEQSN